MLNSKKSLNSKELSADQGFYYIHVALYFTNGVTFPKARIVKDLMNVLKPIGVWPTLIGHENNCNGEGTEVAALLWRQGLQVKVRCKSEVFEEVHISSVFNFQLKSLLIQMCAIKLE